MISNGIFHKKKRRIKIERTITIKRGKDKHETPYTRQCPKYLHTDVGLYKCQGCNWQKKCPVMRELFIATQDEQKKQFSYQYIERRKRMSGFVYSLDKKFQYSKTQPKSFDDCYKVDRVIEPKLRINKPGVKVIEKKQAPIPPSTLCFIPEDGSFCAFDKSMIKKYKKIYILGAEIEKKMAYVWSDDNYKQDMFFAVTNKKQKVGAIVSEKSVDKHADKPIFFCTAKLSLVRAKNRSLFGTTNCEVVYTEDAKGKKYSRCKLKDVIDGKVKPKGAFYAIDPKQCEIMYTI